MVYNDNFNLWLNCPNLTSIEKEQLEKIKNDEKEKKECFEVSLEFGTAGMRGILGMGTNRMNRFMVMLATEALAKTIEKKGEKAKKKGVAISFDTRNFSREFAEVASGVLAKHGIKVYLFKECRPVPMLSFAICNLQASCGIMITASHNPKEYNGYKVYGDDGAQMSLDDTNAIIQEMSQIGSPLNIACVDIHNNAIVEEILEDIDKLYEREILKNVLSKKAISECKDDVKMVYTSIHGSGLKPVTSALDSLGINYTLVKEQATYDGNFSTVAVPNPETTEALSKAIELANKIEADVVFGTDPDCDRLGVAIRCDKDGKFMQLTGNQVGFLILDYILTRLKEEKKLPKNAVVVKSIVTTEMARLICQDYGVEIEDVLVGFKFIGEKIKNYQQSKVKTFVFGFEESCGYLFGDQSKDKDAVCASVLISEMICYYATQHISLYKKLVALYAKYGFYEDRNINIEFKGLDGMAKMKNIMTCIRESKIDSIGGLRVLENRDYQKQIIKCKDGTQKSIDLPKSNIIYYELEGGNRVVLRPSGTEPKLKIYLGAKGIDENDAQKTINKITKDVERVLDSYA